ncbi:MAG: spermidine/putrescine transporter substrate-binding protein [Aeromicrobium sp.]|jgi:putative spermidine/putrescine transport system substrate-binding protein|uniref:ABC transporter substrate-binding protein n=1 Tax=Aeromicrobium sp. TaxID=1871063 RepID=UPI002605B8F5|nr:ABC transporter substrate-binding protein [Aeromicrobium sp.]MCW2790564.1 spermidine/putrescine transporter substrate-binding protein [Aeromicrobium sp.]MCW2823814.1 spermidine/putrescine transporter substrate-binding protein [Aeromicrobium sp.]
MRTTTHRRRALGALLASSALVALAACGGSDSDSASEVPTKLGKTEGKVSILAWPGYVEDGSNDPKVDWVSKFEKDTGCQVTSKTYGTSDEAFNLAKTGDYDVVVASGDLTARMVASKEAVEVNTDLIPNYAKVFDFLKDQDWNTFDGKHYGVPHGYGANLLMYNEDEVSPAPTSWSAVFEPDEMAKYKGKITAYDSPIYIADAALYLMKTQPELKIKNPYALDQKQFDASVDLLKAQRGNIGEYWSDYLKEISAFETGDSVLGTTWQVIVNSIDTKKTKVKAILPEEGATGWSDTWMISSHAKNPNCAYAWLNYIDSPEANAQATEYFGEAPNSQEACDFASDPGFCDSYKAGDEEFASKLWYWRTPVAECLDGRKDVECKDYSEWTKAWTEIKG